MRLDPAFQKRDITADDVGEENKENETKMMRTTAQCTTLITKATELFIGYMAECVLTHATNAKRKTLTLNDCREVIEDNPRFDFLRAPMRSAFEAIKADHEDDEKSAVEPEKKKRSSTKISKVKKNENSQIK